MWLTGPNVAHPREVSHIERTEQPWGPGGRDSVAGACSPAPASYNAGGGTEATAGPMASSRPEYDVVVVGGGPSGAAVGTLLARSGRSVLIADKARFPRDKPCGGGITGRCARTLGEIFGQDTLGQVTRAASSGFRMFYQGRFLAGVDDGVRMLFVKRREMDAVLLRKAKDAGCEVLEGAEATGVEPSQSAVSFRSGQVVRGAIIVGADGARSIVGRSVRPRQGGTGKGTGFGLVAEVPAAELRDTASQLPQIHFGLVPWGYGWVFPNGDTVSIGVGGLLGTRTDFRQLLKHLVEATCRPGTWDTLHPRGHPLPLGHPERNPGHGHVLLLGDAAGLVESVTGEGISFALESAQLAASAVLRALSGGTPSAAGRAYKAAYRRTLWPHLRNASLARWLFFPRLCLPLAMRSLRRHPKVVEWYLEILAGKMSYPAFFRRLAVELLRRPAAKPRE